MSELITSIRPILKAAGDKILKIYNSKSDFSKIDFKADDSPLTIADTSSNEIIVEKLVELFPDIPIISEEKENVSHEVRSKYKRFWCVDPLDGTKEFINRNGEFTVNIALIEDNFPVFGGIYVPVKETFYFGLKGEGAYKQIGDSKIEKIQVNAKSGDWIAVGSKSHAKPAEKEFYEEIGVKDSFSVGSSLKFCMVAEGAADLYFRAGPTMEWDIAAGHAVVRGAGGEVYQDLDCSKVFEYNKKDLLNGSFLCTSVDNLRSK